MPTILQFRRGTTAQNNSYTGSNGEITIDTDKKTIITHDGSTAGGNPLVSENGTQTLTNKTLTSPNLTTPTIGGTAIDEYIADTVGAMVSGNTESGISVTYDDTDNTLDFDVGDFTITLAGDLSGSATVTNLGNATLTATIAANSVALGTDTTGNYVASLVAGTGVTLSNNSGEGATPTVAIGQAVGTSDNVTFNDLVISGNLTVSGTTTTVNTETVNIADNQIVLNSNYTGSTPTENGGIEIERGTLANKTLVWDETADKWTVGSETFVAGTFEGALTGNATTATTLQTARTINGVSFNGSANIVAEPYVEDDEASNATRYITFVDNGTAGYKRLNEDSTLNYNPSTGTLAATIFSGTATSARYADLAERYTSDIEYSPGTVVVFGGNYEVTESTTSHDTAVAGVVSTDPAYLMNSDLKEGVSVALTGRVPCIVKGPVKKGTVLVTSDVPGAAQAIDPAKFAPGVVIGKALEDLETSETKLIEIAVGRF